MRALILNSGIGKRMGELTRTKNKCMAEIGAVIVKDMSRVGRDYLQVGFYTETLWTRTQKADRETGC